jgi:hypothetical protein
MHEFQIAEQNVQHLETIISNKTREIEEIRLRRRKRPVVMKRISSWSADSSNPWLVMLRRARMHSVPIPPISSPRTHTDDTPFLDDSIS